QPPVAAWWVMVLCMPLCGVPGRGDAELEDRPGTFLQNGRPSFQMISISTSDEPPQPPFVADALLMPDPPQPNRSRLLAGEQAGVKARPTHGRGPASPAVSRCRIRAPRAPET